MLDQMRNNARNWLIYLLFGAIIVVFSINFGPGFDQMGQTGCRARGGTAAVVNGESISRHIFQMRWRSITQNLRIPPKFLKSFNYKGRLMDSLIQTALLGQLGDKYGITVSDKEVHDRILSDPSFQKDEVFDAITFRRVVNNYFGLTTDEYQSYLRRELQAIRVRDVLTQGLIVSDREVKEDYLRKNTKVRLSFVMFDPAKVKFPVKIESKELAAYIKKNEKALKAYYNKNLNKFHKKAKVRARHILFKTTPKDSKEALKKKKDALEKVRQQALKDPKKFPALARKYSQGPTKVRGGDLGLFGKGVMDITFEKAAFALKKPNEISPVIKSRFGYHIIQLVLKKPEVKRTLAQKSVKEEIGRALFEQKKKLKMLMKVAEEFHAMLKQGKDFKTILKPYVVAKKKKKSAKKAKKPAARKVAKKPTSRAAAKKPTSRTVAKKPAARKVAKKPTSRKAATAREQINKAAKKGKSTSRQVAAKAASGDPLAVLRKALRGKFGKKAKSTSSFTRENDIISIAGSRDKIESGKLVRMAFALTKKKPLLAGPFEAKGKIYVFKLKKRFDPDMKKFAKERDELARRLLNSKKQAFIQAWLKQLEKDAKIEKNKKLLSYDTPKTPRR